MNRGKSVYMFATDPSGQGGIASVVAVYQASALGSRVPVKYISTHAQTAASRRLYLFLRALMILLAGLLAKRVSLVHVHSASRVSFWRKSALLALARAFGVPTIFHLHGAEFRQFAEAEASALGQRWIRRTLEASSRVLVLTESWKSWVAEFAPKAEVTVLANPVLRPEPDGPPQQPGRVLFLGGAEVRKGGLELIDALAIVKRTHPGFYLAWGGGGDLSEIKRRALGHGLEEQIEYLGWVRGTEKWRQLCMADVFVLPSHDEGLPMALLEAMAHGKPLIATAVGGIPDAIVDDEHGLLIPARNAEALANALSRYLGDSNLRSRHGAAAQQRAADRYLAEAVLDALLGVYRGLGVMPSYRSLAQGPDERGVEQGPKGS